MSDIPRPPCCENGAVRIERMKRGLCPACGEKGPHFVPPSLGDDGFFLCTEGLLDGRRVPLTMDEST
jgi:hypothetical protein